MSRIEHRISRTQCFQRAPAVLYRVDEASN
jgi:hypothetical protein